MKWIIIFLALTVFTGCYLDDSPSIKTINVVRNIEFDNENLHKHSSIIQDYSGLRDPSYAQMKDLVENVGLGKGNCCDYSKQMQDYSIEQGFQCYIVVMNWKNKDGHVIVAFDTTDREMIYIEPQNKSEVIVTENITYNPPGMIMMGTQDDRIITQKVVFR
jgi:hypothetical protein